MTTGTAGPTSPGGPQGPALALLLLRASRWFDRELLAALHERGWPQLSPAQSLVFAHLDRTGTAPSELARRLGTSRQAAGELVTGLRRAQLLALVDDPGRRGGRLVVLTGSGERLAADAAAHLAVLEERFGAERSAALRGLLADGPAPTRVARAPGPEGG